MNDELKDETGYVVESAADAELTAEDETASLDHAEEVLARHRAQAEADAETRDATPRVVGNDTDIVENDADAELTAEDKTASLDHAEEVLARHRAGAGRPDRNED